jgi:hypothetical protein
VCHDDASTPSSNFVPPTAAGATITALEREREATYLLDSP